MSADLVTQLRQDAQAQRDAAPEGAALWVADRFDQAADEIARLRSDNNRRALLEAGLRDGIDRYRDAIRRLAEQDATLSVCDGNVTVTMDATLTDSEREAITEAINAFGEFSGDEIYVVALRGLLARGATSTREGSDG